MNPNKNLKSQILSTFNNKDLTAKPEIQELQPEPEQLTKGKTHKYLQPISKNRTNSRAKSKMAVRQVAGEGR